MKSPAVRAPVALAGEDHRLAATLPWLAAARRRLARSLREDRLPHALLVQSQPGLGALALVEWTARLALCEGEGQNENRGDDRGEDQGEVPGACGRCPACTLAEAGTHPDLLRVEVDADRRQIRIEQVREMIAELALRSHRGGRKVAIVQPGDALNVNGANALLKTLEEPPAGTLLLLTIERPERLPATIASRCQRLRLAPPPRAEAIGWLETQQAGTDWGGTLALTGGAPLAALALARAGGATLEQDMAALPTLLDRDDPDVVGLAERWSRHLPAERLRWIENWVTERIRRGTLRPAAGHSPPHPGLPAAVRTRHIQALFGVLDLARDCQAQLRGNANVQMLFEGLLLAVVYALSELRAARPR